MMKDDLLQTKLQRSAVPPDVLPRDRLLERLEEGRHRPLTLISAPAG
jgi:LuxR family maltose regulon positive regulatory protein